MDSIAATDRFVMLEQLAHAVRRTHELQVLANRQRERIKILNRAGLKTQTAELVLAQLEQSQMLYVAENERLEAALEKLDASETRVRRECRFPSKESERIDLGGEAAKPRNVGDAGRRGTPREGVQYFKLRRWSR